MRFLILFLLYNITLLGQVKIEGFNSSYQSQVESALLLIKQKDDFKYSRLIEFCKIIKYSESGTSRTENDSMIVIPQSVLGTESVNKIACSIMHETKRLELRIKKFGYTSKKEEYTCYSYEYAFSCRINCEDWLKEQIQEALIQHQ